MKLFVMAVSCKACNDCKAGGLKMLISQTKL